MPLWAQTVHMCVCAHVCVHVCVCVESFTLSSIPSSACLPEGAGTWFSLGSLYRAGSCWKPPLLNFRTCWILRAKGFLCQESGSQVQGCAVNYSLSSPPSGREPCPYTAMNCVFKYHWNFSVKTDVYSYPPTPFIHPKAIEDQQEQALC